MSNFGNIGARVGQGIADALRSMATRTVVKQYQHEADHGEALRMNAAYSATLGRVLRPIPHKDSVYWMRSDRNPCQRTEAPIVVSSVHEDGVRKATSGGPIERSAHLAYQVAYQAARKAKGFGVTLPSGRVVRYQTRARADKARKVVRVFAALNAASKVAR